MKVLLDLVPGHTSTDHEWFRESCKAEKMNIQTVMYGPMIYGMISKM